jgi:rsbT co-antagonist protein RsbR
MSIIPELLKTSEKEIVVEWLHSLASATRRSDLINDQELKSQAEDLLHEIVLAAGRSGNVTNIRSSEWSAVQDQLGNISATRAKQGFSPSETATFVLSLKKPLFDRLSAALISSPKELANELWNATELIDKLGLITSDAYLKRRDQIISRQQEELLELSTPVVTLWDGIVAIPLIGTLDSARTQVVMESLLQEIVRTNSQVAIIDITGVPTVDTLVAQHLLKTITAARLMGADCILSGIRPQIAQTIVHLGINLNEITTKAKLSDALALALQRSGRRVVQTQEIALRSGTAEER